jgi:hypothetical protein
LVSGGLYRGDSRGNRIGWRAYRAIYSMVLWREILFCKKGGKDMTAEEQRLIGGILARLDTIEERQETIRTENRTDHAAIFAKIDTLSNEGCAIGKQHSRDIDELKQRPEKAIGMGAAAASVIALIGSIVAMIMGRS